MMNVDDLETTEPGDAELFAGLRRTVGSAAMTTGITDVEALGRRVRTRHRAMLAGVGTSAAALVAAVAVLAPTTDAGSGAASARAVPTVIGKPLAPGQQLDLQDAGFSLKSKGDGKVTLALEDMFDRDKLQAALASVGIRSRIQRITVPANLDVSGPICQAANPPQYADPDAPPAFRGSSAPNTLTFDAAHIPAGDIVVLDVFVFHGNPVVNGLTISVFKHDPGPCIPTSKSVKVQ